MSETFYIDYPGIHHNPFRHVQKPAEMIVPGNEVNIRIDDEMRRFKVVRAWKRGIRYILATMRPHGAGVLDDLDLVLFCGKKAKRKGSVPFDWIPDDDRIIVGRSNGKIVYRDFGASTVYVTRRT